jgi:hypothetical protein
MSKAAVTIFAEALKLVSIKPRENCGKFLRILKSCSLFCLSTETATQFRAVRYWVEKVRRGKSMKMKRREKR